MLPEFAAFGSLHLAALTELYDHYDQYIPLDPNDPNAVSNREADRNSYALSPLKAAIQLYKPYVQAIRDDIIADRVAKVQIHQEPLMTTMMSPWLFDQTSPRPYITVKTADLYSAKDDAIGCKWNFATHKDDRDAAQRDVDARRKAVREISQSWSCASILRVGARMRMRRSRDETHCSR
jgi:hypothetical protein